MFILFFGNNEILGGVGSILLFVRCILWRIEVVHLVHTLLQLAFHLCIRISVTPLTSPLGEITVTPIGLLLVIGVSFVANPLKYY